LFDLAMVALPVEDAKNLVNTVTGTSLNPIAFTDLFNALLVVARDALNYGRVVGALYRDTIELEVQLWLATPPIDHRPPPFQVTEEDVASLRAIYAGGNDDMPAWISAMTALRNRGLEPLPDPKFFYELGGLMKYICDLITKDPTASKSCKDNLPTTMAPPAPAVGPTPVVAVNTPAQPPPVQGGRQPPSTNTNPNQPGTPTGQPGQSQAMDRAAVILRAHLNVSDASQLQLRQSQLLSLIRDPVPSSVATAMTKDGVGPDLSLDRLLNDPNCADVRLAVLNYARTSTSWGTHLPSP